MKEQRFDKNVYMEFFYWLYQSLASSLCFWCVNILYIAAAFLLSIDGRNVFSFIFLYFYWSRLHRDDRYDRRISKEKVFHQYVCS